MILEPIQRRSASAAVFEQLLEKLLAGEVAEGAALPPERTLTEVLGVNRQAVREALQRLAQAGLVEINQGDATRALDYRRRASLDLLPRLLVGPDGSVDAGVALSIMEMRAAIGPDAARSCARRATPDVIERLEATSQRMQEADAIDALAPLDLAFWDAIVDGSENVAYRLAFNSLRNTYEPLMPVLAVVLEEELRAQEVKSKLVDAIRDGNEAVAASAAADLLARGTEAIIRWFAEGEEGS